MGFSRDEVAELVTALEARDEVAALELNVSCPNVETGLLMGADPAEIDALLARVRPLTAKPLIVKLTPNATDVPGGGPGRRGGGRERRVADQHAARHGARPGVRASRGSAGRPAASPVPAVRAVALAQVGAVATRSRFRSSGWAACRAAATRSI